jgi:hypothetical protein
MRRRCCFAVYFGGTGGGDCGWRLRVRSTCVALSQPAKVCGSSRNLLRTMASSGRTMLTARSSVASIATVASTCASWLWFCAAMAVSKPAMSAAYFDPPDASFALFHEHFALVRGSFYQAREGLRVVRGHFDAVRDRLAAVHGSFAVVRENFAVMRGDFSLGRGISAVVHEGFAAVGDDFEVVRRNFVAVP